MNDGFSAFPISINNASIGEGTICNVVMARSILWVRDLPRPDLSAQVVDGRSPHDSLPGPQAQWTASARGARTGGYAAIGEGHATARDQSISASCHANEKGVLMIMVCIQCAMRAVVDDRPVPTFDESWDEHMERHHPDPVETYRERQELERHIAERFGERFADYVKRNT